MKLWGDLDDPRKTLSGEGRALDLLGVRYLLVKNPAREPVSPFKPGEDPRRVVKLDGYLFADDGLSAPALKHGERLVFNVPRFDTDHFALVSSLAWSLQVPDGTPVARIHLHAEDGRVFEFYLRSGEHTADWSHDRPDIQAQVRQRRPPVATSNLVEDQQAGRYEGHTSVAGFALPERSTLVGGDIELMDVVGAPQLSLSIQRLSLIDETEDDALPLRADWIVKEPQGNSSGTDGSQLAHWRRLGETNVLVAYENTRARAWLASDAKVMKEEEILGVIRSGKLPDGTASDPLRTALVGAPLDLHEASVADASSRAEVVAYEPNRVEIKTTSSEPSILVLTDNYYSGWRAYLDGGAVETLRVNYNLRGVPLAGGNHRVEFFYRPKAVLIGLIISLLTLALLVLWAKRPLLRPAK